MQGATDALRSNNAKIQKELDDFKKPQNQQDPENNPFATELAEMKSLLVGMQTKIAESEKKARYEAIVKDAHAKMKALGCTNDFIREATLRGLELTDADTADSIAERFKSVYDENCKQAFGEGYIPPKGNNAGGKDEVNYDAMVAGLMASGAIPKQD
jgi:hypothetical protein